MRPWFTLTIIVILACCLVLFLFIVDFVLINREMFEMPFNIMIRVPFTTWSHTWEEVQFMYILTICILLGAGLVAITTLVFDTKRTLKVRSMRKELDRLQEALQEAQALQPTSSQKEKVQRAEPDEGSQASETTPDLPVSAEDETPIMPEDVSHSFEDIVEQGDFVKTAQKRVDEELERHDGVRPEADIRTRVTETSVDLAESQADEIPDERKKEENIPKESDGAVSDVHTESDLDEDAPQSATRIPDQNDRENSSEESSAKKAGKETPHDEETPEEVEIVEDRRKRRETDPE